VIIDGSQIVTALSGARDGSENYVNFSALDGGYAVDILRVFAGIKSDCTVNPPTPITLVVNQSFTPNLLACPVQSNLWIGPMYPAPEFKIQ